MISAKIFWFKYQILGSETSKNITSKNVLHLALGDLEKTKKYFFCQKIQF